jgi:membrane protein, MarC family
VIDPIGTVPVFIAITRGYGATEKRKIALKGTFFAAAVLLFFVLAGGPILTAMSIPLSAFQISGGIVLFVFALFMVFGESKPEEEKRLIQGQNEMAIFPLAVPSMASPGAMLASVLLTDHTRFGVWEQIQTVIIMLLVLVFACVLMLGASFIDRFLGNAGASVISRVMGIILASVATNHILRGLSSYFSIPIT